MKIYTKQLPFWLLTFAVMIGLTLPVLIQNGMFIDAMLYTSVSHNLGQGIGTFWFPQFSLHNVAGLSSFHEQPPLAFGIQAIFYKVLGNSMYVERLYTLIVMCITAFLIHLTWREIFKDEVNIKKLSWLPIFLWITIPVCFWSYTNNMEENTMVIFVVSSLYFMFKAVHSENKQLLFWILAGISIFLATLSKGLPGFFPIIFPALYWLVIKKISFPKMLLYTFILILTPVILYLILLLFKDSRESLSIYFFKRVLHRINEAPTVDYRWRILVRILTELIPQAIMVLIMYLVARIKKIQFSRKHLVSLSILLIAIGLSGSMPLALTMVQKGFYIVPSLPFFGIGIAILLAYLVSELIEKININSTRFKVFVSISIFMLLISITFTIMQKGKVRRDKETLNDVFVIGKNIPRCSVATIPGEMWDDWVFQCYLMRYCNISLDPSKQNKYFIINKSIKTTVDSTYKKINVETVRYDIYQKE